MQIESLKQYIIVDSKKIHARVITKREAGTWKFDELTNIEDKIFIEPINFESSLAELYERVKF